MKLPWTKGPTAKFREGIHAYEVSYRYRIRGTTSWTRSVLPRCVATSKDDAMRRTIGFLRKAHRNIEVDLLHVKQLADEAPIQTGQKVETVSESEYESIQQEKAEKTEYERKEVLREGGLWIP